MNSRNLSKLQNVIVLTANIKTRLCYSSAKSPDYQLTFLVVLVFSVL